MKPEGSRRARDNMQKLDNRPSPESRIRKSPLTESELRFQNPLIGGAGCARPGDRMAGPEMERLSTDKHCELLSANVRERSASIYEGFKLFVQLFSALVGGAVIIRLQHPKDLPTSFVTLSNALALLITFAGVILVTNGLWAWWGHRKKLSEVAGKDETGNAIIPPPRIGLGQVSVWIMIFVMVISCVVFWWFNPLRTT